MSATSRSGYTAAVSFVVLMLGHSATAWADVEAYPGQPFGVARISLPLNAADAKLAFASGGFAVQERDGRALYPVFTEGRVLRLLDQILGGDNASAPSAIDVLFLFTGDGPMDVTLSTPTARRVTITPRPARNPRFVDRLLMRWWREYNATVRDRVNAADYPPLVETYLTSMLSRRLGLEPPLLSRVEQPTPGEPAKTMQLLMGLESLRMATLRKTNLGQLPVGEVANIPAPADIQWTPLPSPVEPSDVEIEPIAMHVPHECFYIRFGSFTNYLWMERLLKDYGGDLGGMITLRGHDAQLGQRMQDQIVLHQSALAEVMGPAVISDVAFIGRDIYLRDGAAVGMLFQARNPLLGVDLNEQRAEILAAEKDNGATEKTVEIAGRDVSFLSTPDNRIRSFYVVDGDYHLVASSRAVVERFLEVSQAKGAGSLGASPEFRYARTIMPTAREDTIFAYFSSAFFQGLISPQYQIELNRRLRAVTEMELLELARWAARVERKRADTVDDLVGGGLLPAGFGRRPDNSEPIVADGKMLDSLRGARGTFTPIPDVPIEFVTRSEATQLAAQAAFYRDRWQSMDPLMVGVKRYALEGERMERIAIDAHVSPFSEGKYGWMTSLLGPPTKVRIRPAPGDIITAQAVVEGGQLSNLVPPHHLFLGIQDNAPLTDMRSAGILQTLTTLQTTPGYLGAWPKPGFLDWLPLGLGGGPPDAHGYSRLLFGLWRRQWDVFSVLSFDPHLLAHVSPHLIPEEAESEAQVRIRVGDLSTAQLQTWVNSLAHARSHQASLGNAKLLHALSQQLGVPRDEARSVAERLLDAKLMCTLGGDYQLAQRPGRVALWQSTHWPDPVTGALPAEYRAPLLDWFRGMEAEMTMYEDCVILHAVLDMQRKPSEKKVQLPFFNLDILGGRKKPLPGQPLPKPPLEEIKPPPKDPKVAPR